MSTSPSTSLSIGAHVEQTDPIAEALARETTLVQFFLGDPQGYKGPEVRFAGGAAALRAAAEQAGIHLYAASCASTTWTRPPRWGRRA